MDNIFERNLYEYSIVYITGKVFTKYDGVITGKIFTKYDGVIQKPWIMENPWINNSIFYTMYHDVADKTLYMYFNPTLLEE